MTTRIGLACAGAALVALAWSAAPAQEPAGKPAAKADVVAEDTTGTAHRLVQGRLFAETLGLLSVSLEPSDVFQLTVGAGTVKIPVRKIRRVEFAGETPGAWTAVTVTDIDGGTVSGKPVTPAKWELRGQMADAAFAEDTLTLDRVRSLQFTRDPAARACTKCQRIYADAEWRYCPHDGQRLPKE